MGLDELSQEIWGELTSRVVFFDVTRGLGIVFLKEKYTERKIALLHLVVCFFLCFVYSIDMSCNLDLGSI